MTTLISSQEVATHNKRDDCWVTLHNKVYNLTNFLPDHPGGADIVMKYAGKDGTKAFEPIHSKDVLVNFLEASACQGPIDPATVVEEEEAPEEKKEAGSMVLANGKPPLEHMVNLYDFEAVAKVSMTQEGWDYYSSGADDEITLRDNRNAYQRIWFRPRILINVKNIDMASTILGHHTSIPIYITATALGKLAHPLGEVNLTRAAHTHKIVQMIPTLGSCTLDEVVDAAQPDQVQFLQLYVNSNRKVTERYVRHAEARGIKALFITVDAPQLGRREKDMRNKFKAVAPSEQEGSEVNRSGGTARAISAFIDPSLCWDDLAWFKSITNMPIILKGVQSAADAIKAVEYGVKGIVLSNHGGRQLDCAPSGIELLPEVMDALRSIGAEKKLDVFVDGGVRRGADIFKALALGAKAVGIGRPFLYGMAGYGQQGVEKVIQILKDDLEMTMRLTGAPRIKDISSSLIDTRSLSTHTSLPIDHLQQRTYIPLETQSARVARL